MIDEITVDHLFNEIKMGRALFKGTYVVVEGLDDENFYSQYFVATESEFIVSRGKENSIEILDRLQGSPDPHTIFILDRDFDFLQGNQLKDPCVFYTDCHDLEMMVINSNAFYKVINHLGSKRKCDYFSSRHGGRQLKDLILECASNIGYCRWLSHRESLSFDFKELAYNKIVDKESLDVDIDCLLAAVQRHLRTLRLTAADIEPRLTILRGLSQDHLDICSGSDVIHVISVAMRKAIGTRSSQDSAYAVLLSHFFVAYESTSFASTALHTSLHQWEKSNGRKILNN